MEDAKHNMVVLRYGDGASVAIEMGDDFDSYVSESPCQDMSSNVREETQAALAHPLDYPPLAECVVPGDHVVLALGGDVPQVAEITAAVVQSLVACGVVLDDIRILCPCEDEADAAGTPSLLAGQAFCDGVQVLRHTPDDRNQLAYLAADEDGEAILLHRALHDADVVLPIGCVRDDDATGYFGIHGVVYPSFSDAKTMQRFRGLGSLDSTSGRKRELVGRVEQAAWLLGLHMTIQVVPGDDGRIAHILAGESGAVERRGRELYVSQWRRAVARQAKLVVAGIRGPAAQQTWENLGRTIRTAGNFVEEGGAIAVCCELDAQPGPAVQRLAGGESRADAMRHVGRQRPIDALPAAQIAAALERNKVYLLSRLDASLVEELDIIPLETPDELVRLIGRYSSCAWLPSAQYIAVGDRA